jgi:hypothetical protein
MSIFREIFSNFREIFSKGFEEAGTVLKETSKNPKNPEKWIQSLTEGAENVATKTEVVQSRSCPKQKA